MRDERLQTCPMCKNGVEDECHFMFYCQEYHDKLRKANMLFKSPLVERKDLISIMRSQNIDIIVNTAKFLAEASKARERKLKLESGVCV